MMAYVLIEDGVVILKQPDPRDGFIECPDEVVCGFLYDGVTFTAPVAPPAGELPLVLTQIACARLLVDGWDVTGIERSSGLSVAFVADTDTVWAFFNEPQPDTYYVVMPDDGVTKHEDYLVITRPGLSAINLVVSRVQ
jgi:hypothetical protein